MKKLVWVYVSHPYTGDEERNRAEAAEIQRFLQERYPDILFLNPIAARLRHDRYERGIHGQSRLHDGTYNGTRTWNANSVLFEQRRAT